MKRLWFFSLWALLLSACAHTGLPPIQTDEPTASSLPVSQPTAPPGYQANPNQTPTPLAKAAQNLITSQPLATNASSGEECIRSFAEFAYFNNRIPTLAPEATPAVIPPLPPWRIEAAIPDYKSTAVYEIPFFRSNKRYREIWIGEYVTDQNSVSRYSYWIYRPELQDWKYISAEIEKTGIFASAYFVTQDGTIWGKSIWDTINDQISIQNVPVLNKFNENGRFEFVRGALEIPLRNGYAAFQPAMSKQKDIWILVDQDGIYRYDPVHTDTKKMVDLPSLTMISYLPFFDEEMYFQSYTYDNSTVGTEVFRFLPSTGEIEALNTPDDWKDYTGSYLLIDRANNLWFGARGYRAKDGSWHSIWPENEAIDSKNSPQLLLESSHGLLWYFLSSEDKEIDGTAWYDPQTRKGCEFTNLPLGIAEDSEQNLWTVAEGKLYINDTYARQK